MKNIVTVGGGTGSYTVLCGLKKFNDTSITAIVSMADDGGSTGRLRDELGVLPAGDVRQCLVALSENTSTIRTLMNYRFEEGDLRGHSFGNMFLAALEKVTGSFTAGVEVASDILKIQGKVIPVTEDKATLMMQLNDGSLLMGEDSINHGDLQSAGISLMCYKEDIHINSHARRALMQADMIVIGPGNLYCSILPNLIVKGFKNVLKDTKATIVLPINLTNKKGHTSDWKVSDYVLAVEKELERSVDIIVVNNEVPSSSALLPYTSQEGSNVLIENDLLDDARVILAPILSHEKVVYSQADTLTNTRSLIRHDSDKLARVLVSLI